MTNPDLWGPGEYAATAERYGAGEEIEWSEHAAQAMAHLHLAGQQDDPALRAAFIAEAQVHAMMAQVAALRANR